MCVCGYVNICKGVCVYESQISNILMDNISEGFIGFLFTLKSHILVRGNCVDCSTYILKHSVYKLCSGTDTGHAHLSLCILDHLFRKFLEDSFNDDKAVNHNMIGKEFFPQRVPRIQCGKLPVWWLRLTEGCFCYLIAV